ncbi:unnamed protein product [Fraxinus pennsylvanica]|uniref:fructose-bisphosphate aldolase n=1 Tax=Fraxinus pennsylvanica TaxID=56036 RepID=A0AAD2EF36_9LAMI|nr:unnamed protein product [Fraxinus pennsylvanica]
MKESKHQRSYLHVYVSIPSGFLEFVATVATIVEREERTRAIRLCYGINDAEAFSERLKRELQALEAANVHVILENEALVNEGKGDSRFIDPNKTTKTLEFEETSSGGLFVSGKDRKSIASPGRGILAIDESNVTCGKRLASIGLDNTETNRQAYRQLLLTTPSLDDYISVAILFEETLYQSTTDGKKFVDCLRDENIVPGTKVDKGLVLLPGSNNEFWCQGLDGLASRSGMQNEDNPVGTGYSFVEQDDKNLLVQTDVEVPNDLTTLLIEIFKRNESLQNGPLYVVVESYGGKYVVTLGLLALNAIEVRKLKLKLGVIWRMDVEKMIGMGVEQHPNWLSRYSLNYK